MTNTMDMDELLNKLVFLTRTLHEGHRVKSYFITDDFKICYLQGRETLTFLTRDHVPRYYTDPEYGCNRDGTIWKSPPMFRIRKAEDILDDLPKELRKLVLFNMSMFR